MPDLQLSAITLERACFQQSHLLSWYEYRANWREAQNNSLERTKPLSSRPFCLRTQSSPTRHAHIFRHFT